jgi:lipoprotein-anchoring transpeptidase ErfK/SrfK
VKSLLRKLLVAAAVIVVSVAPGFDGRPVEAEPVTSPTPTPPAEEPAPIPPPPAPQPANPDPKHPTGDLIEVSIEQQRLFAWSNGTVVNRFVISTGREGYETPPGHYKILEKYKNRWSRKWSVWMPYAMRWYEGYFIHQLPHKDGSSVNIGASKLGKPDSHGCVRVNVGDAEKLFNWTKIGTPVWVH